MRCRRCEDNVSSSISITKSLPAMNAKQNFVVVSVSRMNLAKMETKRVNGLLSSQELQWTQANVLKHAMLAARMQSSKMTTEIETSSKLAQ